MFYWRLLLLIQLAALPVQAGMRIAITVDDLPAHGEIATDTTRAEVVRKIIAVLKKHQVPEVYGFINAGLVEKMGVSDEVFQIWKSSGYPFGNHTYLHADIDRVPVEQYTSEIDLNEKMLKSLSGSENWKVFRYPYLKEGSTLEKRNAVRNHLLERGYRTAQVTVDFKDWAWNDPYARCKKKGDLKSIGWLRKSYLRNAVDHLSRAKILSKALFSRDITHILLLHVGGFDAEMLDALLAEYKKLGATLISLSKAMEDPAYAVDPALAFDDTTDFLFQILRSQGKTLKSVGIRPFSAFPEKKLQEICR